MVKDNVNYGKLAYDQVLNFEKEKVIINQNTDFKLKSQFLLFSDKTHKVINFKSNKNNIVSISIETMTLNSNYNLIILLNIFNIINLKNINCNKKININVVVEKNNKLEFFTESNIDELIEFKVEILGEFKDIEDRQYFYLIPGISKSYGLIYDKGKTFYKEGEINSIVNFKDLIDLGDVDVLDFKPSLKNNDMLSRFDNIILLINNNGIILKEYNVTGFQSDYKLDVGTIQNIKYLPINNENYKHQLIGLEDGNVVTFFLDNDFNIIKTLNLKLIKKNQIKEIYTLNYLKNVKYENMFIVKDILDNLYLYINIDDMFSSENCYSEPIYLGKGGVKTIAYLKTGKLILLNSHSNYVLEIQFDFNNLSKVKKISRVKEKEYLNVNELLIGDNDQILLWSPNIMLVKNYE